MLQSCAEFSNMFESYQVFSALAPKKYLKIIILNNATCGCGGMADAPDLESDAERHGGSSPSIRTKIFVN